MVLLHINFRLGVELKIIAITWRSGILQIKLQLQSWKGGWLMAFLEGIGSGKWFVKRGVRKNKGVTHRYMAGQEKSLSDPPT